MKTDFLKSLNITDQTVIDAIMAENGKDINRAKGETETLNTKVTDLQTQLGERDKQLRELKKAAKDNDALTQKITELETANKTAATEYENKLTAMQKAHAIEGGIRDAKAKNVKAVTALLDMEKISYVDGKLIGLNDQIEALRKGEDTSFLFQSEQGNPPPAGTKLNNPPDGGNGGNGGNPATGGLASAIAKALGGNK